MKKEKAMKLVKDIIIGNKFYTSLAHANDSGCSFDEIADYIEENYKDL